jgi:hypothetical protein
LRSIYLKKGERMFSYLLITTRVMYRESRGSDKIEFCPTDRGL